MHPAHNIHGLLMLQNFHLKYFCFCHYTLNVLFLYTWGMFRLMYHVHLHMQQNEESHGSSPVSF